MGEKRDMRLSFAIPEKLGIQFKNFADKTGRSYNGAYIHIIEEFFSGTTSQVLETQRSLDVNSLLISTTLVLAVGTVSANPHLVLLSFGLALVTVAKIFQH